MTASSIPKAQVSQALCEALDAAEAVMHAHMGGGSGCVDRHD